MRVLSEEPLLVVLPARHPAASNAKLNLGARSAFGAVSSRTPRSTAWQIE
jgi:hypothetical protein